MWIVVAFFASTILSVVVLRWFPVWFTPLMFIRLGQQMSQGRELTLPCMVHPPDVYSLGTTNVPGEGINAASSLGAL